MPTDIIHSKRVSSALSTTLPLLLLWRESKTCFRCGLKVSDRKGGATLIFHGVTVGLFPG